MVDDIVVRMVRLKTTTGIKTGGGGIQRDQHGCSCIFWSSGKKVVMQTYHEKKTYPEKDAVTWPKYSHISCTSSSPLFIANASPSYRKYFNSIWKSSVQFKCQSSMWQSRTDWVSYRKLLHCSQIEGWRYGVPFAFWAPAGLFHLDGRVFFSFKFRMRTGR